MEFLNENMSRLISDLSPFVDDEPFSVLVHARERVAVAVIERLKDQIRVSLFKH